MSETLEIFSSSCFELFNKVFSFFFTGLCYKPLERIQTIHLYFVPTNQSYTIFYTPNPCSPLASANPTLRGQLMLLPHKGDCTVLILMRLACFMEHPTFQIDMGKFPSFCD